MKKKFAALVMALAMAFSFAACDDSGNSESAPETVTVTETAPAETPEAPATTEAPEVPDAPPAGDLDAIFLQVVHEQAPATTVVPDADLIDLAHTICDAWDAGLTFEDIAQSMFAGGLTANQGGTIIGAGTQVYCPEYTDRIG